MRRPTLGEVLAGAAVTALLDRLGAPPGRRPARRQGAVASRGDAPASRSPATFAMLALGAVALVTMLVFEAAITRVVGVVCIFGFIVAGVFAIAEPGFLSGEVDDRT